MTPFEIRHIETDAESRFVVPDADDNTLALLRYDHLSPEVICIREVRVSETLRGQGIARKLVDAGVEWAREHHHKIVPQCTYAQRVLQESAYADVVA